MSYDIKTDKLFEGRVLNEKKITEDPRLIDLYLIRHVESVANLKPEFISGRSNHVPITSRGEKQGLLLQKRLRDEGIDFDVLYSSPAVRADKTARIVSEGQHVRTIVCDELQELHQGDWVGVLRREAYTQDIMDKMWDDPWSFKAPGGESQKEVGKRMMDWLDNEIMDRNESLMVGVFSHGVAIKCLLRELMGFNSNITWRIPIDNASITHIRYYEQVWSPVVINDTRHLYLANI